MINIRNPLAFALASALAFGASVSLAGAQTANDNPTAQSMQPAQEDAARLPPSETPQPMDEATPESMPKADAPISSQAPAPTEPALAARAGSDVVPDSVRAKFEALDVDHDGSIDKQEAAASDVLASQFTALNTSGSGKLSLQEFAAASDLALISVDHAQRRE